jgi:hypothetical protein
MGPLCACICYTRYMLVVLMFVHEMTKIDYIFNTLFGTL